jgi:hypothetical protein
MLKYSCIIYNIKALKHANQKMPIIYQEYSCTKCNNYTTEQLVIIMCITRLTINTTGKFIQ